MLRKIKSCPANICNMAHRKKPKKESKEQQIFIVPTKASRIIKKGDVVDEIVTSSLLDVNVHDPSEQLFFLLILRKLLSKTKTNYKNAFYEICIRAAISCVTHKLMETAIIHIHLNSHMIR